MSAFKITISRDSNNMINLSLIDCVSNIRFFNGEMSLENYALLLSGLSRVPIEGNTYDLDCVGKSKVTEPRSIEAPENIPSSKYSEWLDLNAKESGWTVNSYLGSKCSRTHNAEGKTVLNYSVYKYVDPLESPTNTGE